MAVDATDSTVSSVFETPIQILALAICNRLEKAGIPVSMTKKFGFHVWVPQSWAQEARELLYARPPRGEHFLLAQ